MSKLYAGRFTTSFTGYHITGGTMAEAFDRVERLGIRWNLETFGVERIEVTVKTKGPLDQYNRMNTHFGGDNKAMQRLAVFDSNVYQCVSGFITGIRPEGQNKVTYIAKGPGWNHYDQYGPTVTNYTTSTTTSAMLINFLEDDVFILSDDMSNIEETSTALGGWQHPARFGMYPGDYIEFARKAGNSAGQLWDYWCVDRPMLWGNLQDFTPHFSNRANRTSVDWRVSIIDMSSLSLDRDMSDFRSSANIWYGTYAMTAASGGGTATLNVTGATFLDGRFSVGDEVRNITDGSTTRIREIVSSTQLLTSNLTGGSDNLFSNGDSVSIQCKALFNNSDSGSYSTFHHLNRRIAEHRTELNATQADQYSDAMFNFYGVPVQSAALTISAPYIRDANGAKRPLWAPIFEGGGVIQITDLYPAAAVSLNQATNNLDTFFITSMDYDYTSNQLRVGVNVPDSRLDAKLRMAGILGSEMIARAG
mgnify:FL=1